MNLDLNQTMKKKRNIFLKTQNHHFNIILKSKKIQLFTPNLFLVWVKNNLILHYYS